MLLMLLMMPIRKILRKNKFNYGYAIFKCIYYFNVLQVIDNITTSLRDRFLENIDLHLYRDVESLLLSTDPPSDNNKHLPVVEASTVTARLSDINCESLELELNLIRTCKTNGNMKPFHSYMGMTTVLLGKPKDVRLMFPETMKLINLLAVVPASSATAERSFSSLRRLKTWLRSTTTQARLNSLAILTVHRDYEPCIDEVLSKFIGLNELRQRIFGH
jgi:hypothetical protein